MTLYCSSKEGEKVCIVEVERRNPSKLYRYTEQANDYEERLTFIKFMPEEPDPSVFIVPAEICGQHKVIDKYHQHLYLYTKEEKHDYATWNEIGLL
jgi:hypothetical protein